MAYRDPYRDPFSIQSKNEQRQADSISGSTGPGQTYDPSDLTHRSYDQAGPGREYELYDGYSDEPDPLHAALPLNDAEPYPVPPPKDGTLDHDFAPVSRPRQQRTTKALKRYRYDIQGNLWTKGGSGRCICRFCGCTILITLFLIISVVLSIVLWIRPPNIDIGNVVPRGTGNPTQVSPQGMNISLGVSIGVSNPNFFSVTLRDINAQITYPINNTNIGGGEQKDVVFPSKTRTTFTFPFTIVYQTAEDPGNKILMDLATKCGVPSGQRSDITVKYKITLGLQIFFITISPVVANTFTFSCPVSASDLSKLLQAAGLSGLDGG